MSLSNTANLNPKDVIEIGTGLTARRVVVVENHGDGVAVLWFTPEGMGPYTALLPHGSVFQRIYEDESLGRGESFWDTHPDFTGRTGEF